MDCGLTLDKTPSSHPGATAAISSAQEKRAEWRRGHPVVSLVGQSPLELPPTDREKIDAEPEDEIMTEIRATRRKLMAEREAGSRIVREEPPEK